MLDAHRLPREEVFGTIGRAEAPLSDLGEDLVVAEENVSLLGSPALVVLDPLDWISHDVEGILQLLEARHGKILL